MERLITNLVNNKMVLKNEQPVVTLVDEFVKRGAKIELIRISFLEKNIHYFVFFRHVSYIF